MTDNEIAAALSAAPERFAASLAHLRRSDLEAIATSRGVRARPGESAADLAQRVVSVATDRAKRGVRRSKRSR